MLHSEPLTSGEPLESLSQSLLQVGSLSQSLFGEHLGSPFWEPLGSLSQSLFGEHLGSPFWEPLGSLSQSLFGEHLGSPFWEPPYLLWPYLLRPSSLPGTLLHEKRSSPLWRWEPKLPPPTNIEGKQPTILIELSILN
jgi:hypothetical protein